MNTPLRKQKTEIRNPRLPALCRATARELRAYCCEFGPDLKASLERTYGREVRRAHAIGRGR